MVEKLSEGLEDAAVDSSLGILIPCRQDVTKGPKGGYRNNHLFVSKKSAQAWHHVALQEDNDSLITTFIRDVGQCPADVVKNFWRV